MDRSCKLSGVAKKGKKQKDSQRTQITVAPRYLRGTASWSPVDAQVPDSQPAVSADVNLTGVDPMDVEGQLYCSDDKKEKSYKQ